MTSNTDKEIKPIPGFPGYFVSYVGVVYSCKRSGSVCTNYPPRPLKITYANQGRGEKYQQVELWHGGKCHKRWVHRLVLEAFSGPCPEDCQVARHLNDIHDDNRFENLVWGTRVENEADKKRNRRKVV